jgi:outer membrane protein OmpA-like peptidoglycan-associated protein
MHTYDKKSDSGSGSHKPNSRANKDKFGAPTSKPRLSPVNTNIPKFPAVESNIPEFPSLEGNIPSFPTIDGPVQMQSADNEEAVSQMKSPDPLSSKNQASSSGDVHLSSLLNRKGLPDPIRSQMETSFDADFSSVQVHHGSEAARKTSEIGALAYTQGENIYFNQGMYAPDTRSGKELIGHELTHVVQQRAGKVKATGQAKGLPVNQDPALEREADAMGAKAAQGQETGMANTGGRKAMNGVAQMARHEMRVEDTGGEHILRSDDSYLDVTTGGVLISDTGKEYFTSIPHAYPKVIDAKPVVADGSDHGVFSVMSSVEVMLDYWPDIVRNEPLITTFEYKVAPNDKVTFAPTRDEKLREVRSIHKDLKLIKDISGTTDELFKQRVFVYQEPKDKKINEIDVTHQKSNTDYGFELGGSYEHTVTLDVHAELNGKDIKNIYLGLRGGGKFKAGTMNDVKSKSPGLFRDIMANLDELLEKQTISLDYSPTFAYNIGAHFGYEYEKEWQNLVVETTNQAYQVGGILAEEVNIAFIRQDLKSGGDFGFPKDKAHLEGRDAIRFEEWLEANKAIIEKMQGLTSQYYIELATYASSDGSDDYNQNLTDARGSWAHMELMAKGVLDDHIRPFKSHGEAFSDQDIDRPNDRKVKIRIFRK